MDFVVQNAVKNADSEKFDGIEVNQANIKVVGVGGAGNNMVDWLYKKGIKGAEILACNTDNQHLVITEADRKFIIGKDLTRGLGCGGFPDKRVQKIIAISSMSDYRKNINKAGPVVKLSYSLKGVDLSPDDKINAKLSPKLVIEGIKKGISESEWNKLARRVLLIHCINDKIIKIVNLNENKEALNLSEDNIVLFKKGGHAQKKNELALVGATAKFFHS